MLSGDEVAELSNFIEHVSRTSMSGKPSDVKKYACRVQPTTPKVYVEVMRVVGVFIAGRTTSNTRARSVTRTLCVEWR